MYSCHYAHSRRHASPCFACLLRVQPCQRPPQTNGRCICLCHPPNTHARCRRAKALRLKAFSGDPISCGHKQSRPGPGSLPQAPPPSSSSRKLPREMGKKRPSATTILTHPGPLSHLFPPVLPCPQYNENRLSLVVCTSGSSRQDPHRHHPAEGQECVVTRGRLPGSLPDTSSLGLVAWPTRSPRLHVAVESLQPLSRRRHGNYHTSYTIIDSHTISKHSIVACYQQT